MLNNYAAITLTSLPDPQTAWQLYTVSIPLPELKQTYLLLHHKIHEHLLWADNTRHIYNLETTGLLFKFFHTIYEKWGFRQTEKDKLRNKTNIMQHVFKRQ